MFGEKAMGGTPATASARLALESVLRAGLQGRGTRHVSQRRGSIGINIGYNKNRGCGRLFELAG